MPCDRTESGSSVAGGSSGLIAALRRRASSFAACRPRANVKIVRRNSALPGHTPASGLQLDGSRRFPTLVLVPRSVPEPGRPRSVM